MTVSYEVAFTVIDYLKALEPAYPRTRNPCTYTRISHEQGDDIARLIHRHGGFDLFVELDERPGQFDHRYGITDWHWKLRQARNDRANSFFAIINGRESS